jgi:hypothetical protein
VACYIPETLKCRDPYIGLVSDRILGERLTVCDSEAAPQKMVRRFDMKRAKSVIATGADWAAAPKIPNPKCLQTSHLPSRKPAFAHEPAAQPIVTVPYFASAAWVDLLPHTIRLAALHDSTIRGETDAPIHGVAGQDDKIAAISEIGFEAIVGRD